MKEVTLYGGTIDSCLKSLREMAAAEKSGEVLKAVFNDKYLLSTDTDDDAYLRITGKTKAEHDEYVRKWQEDYEAKKKAHEARIPELTEHYRKVARGLVIESELEYWDEIVPIRLGDLYRGMELDQVLDCARVMRDETLSRIERLRKAYKIFSDAGHSGMSAGLTMAMLRRFCPDGNELADACNEFRYDPDHKTKLYVSRDGDGKRTVATADDLTADRIQWSLGATVGIKFSKQFALQKTARRVDYNAAQTPADPDTSTDNTGEGGDNGGSGGDNGNGDLEG